MKTISVITPCYNEEDNVDKVYEAVKHEFSKVANYDYEHIYIDNASIDCTREKLRRLADSDKRVKLIFNSRNFGQLRSPYHAICQAKGDAVILFLCDLQDPPSLILPFISEWEKGCKIVIGVKSNSHESRIQFLLRTAYYKLIKKISNTPAIEHFTGFGLYDKCIVDVLKKIQDPEPYFRGIICEIGYEIKELPYVQPLRKYGKSKNNFFSLYDLAMTGITMHSKAPLRLATTIGFILSFVSFLLAVSYLLMKLFYWEQFSMGMAPLLIGIFFFSSIQLFFIGLLGEYLLSVLTLVKNRPLVIEQERVNF